MNIENLQKGIFELGQIKEQINEILKQSNFSDFKVVELKIGPETLPENKCWIEDGPNGTKVIVCS